MIRSRLSALRRVATRAVGGRRLLRWVPPSASEYVYTVFLKPKPLRKLAQLAIRQIIPARIQLDDVVIVLNQRDAIVSGALALGVYERFELDLFRKMLRPGMTVVDVGSNIGLYTAVAARAVGPQGRVLAIEPDAENCGFVRENIAANHVENVVVSQCAVGAENATGTLYLNDMNKADHRIYQGYDERRTTSVRIVRLDDLLAQHGIEHVDVVKMDIQGAEGQAWRGMDELLAQPDVRLMIEYWPWGLARCGDDPRAFLTKVRAAGFQIFDLDSDAHKITPVVDDAALASLTLERQHKNLLLQRAPLDASLTAYLA
jgi:FkbM family methyltransferase